MPLSNHHTYVVLSFRVGVGETPEGGGGRANEPKYCGYLQSEEVIEYRHLAFQYLEYCHSAGWILRDTMNCKDYYSLEVAFT